MLFSNDLQLLKWKFLGQFFETKSLTLLSYFSLVAKVQKAPTINIVRDEALNGLGQFAIFVFFDARIVQFNMAPAKIQNFSIFLQQI